MIKTPQQLIDASYPLMVKQGRGAYDNGCKYKTEDGFKCAIGVLIPDDKYKPHFEGQTAHSLEILGAAGIDPALQSFAHKYQRAHDGVWTDFIGDNFDFMKEFTKRVQNLCGTFDLKLPKVETEKVEASLVTVTKNGIAIYHRYWTQGKKNV